jgi:membrane-bound serine protease (ClpP class)
MLELFGDPGDFQTMVRRSLAHPDRAVIVLVLGLSAVYRELMRPGRVVPGVVGAVATVLAVQALLRHPLNELGLALLLMSLLLAVLQAFAPLFWLPAAAAGAAALFGTRWLIHARSVGWVAAIAAAVFTAATAVLLRFAWAAWRRKRSV